MAHILRFRKCGMRFAVVPPFAAHAWVEAEGRVVDEPFTVDSFKAFFKVPESSRVDA